MLRGEPLPTARSLRMARVRQGVIGWAAACGLLVGAIVWIDDPDRTNALEGWVMRLSFAMGIWLVGKPLWETIRAAVRTRR